MSTLPLFSPESTSLDLATIRVLDALATAVRGGSVNVFDEDLRYHYAAGSGLVTAGLESKTLVGRTLYELFAPAEVAKVESFYRDAFEGTAVTFDLPLAQRIYEVNATPLPISDRALILVIVQDATAIRIEQNLHRSKTAFVAAVAHELRQPLAPLLTAVAALKLQTTTAETGRLFPIVDRQVAHLTRLVNDLADSAQLSAGRLELALADIDLRSAVLEVIESATTVVRDRHLISDATLPVIVQGDHGRLVQVLANIVFNAVRHTEQNGTIQVTLRAESDWAVLSVVDDGDGIPSGQLPHIFELFTQGDGRHGRMGVGLHLAQGIVAAHGGSIDAFSEGEGLGSRFTIRLPRQRR